MRSAQPSAREHAISLPVVVDVAATGRATRVAAEGRLTDAVRAFAGWPFNDEDIAVAEDAGYSRPQDATSRTCSASSSS